MDLRFFDSVYYSNRKEMSCSDWLLETADSYFALPGTKVDKIRDAMLAGKKLAQEEQSLVDSVFDPVK